MPPAAQMPRVCQNGKPCQCPIMTSAGKMKIMADRAPVAEACVCTMLFSRMLASLNSRNTDIEITAAGMADEKVSPTFNPRNTFDAVNTTVISAPTITPRTVSSGNVIESGTRAGAVMGWRLQKTIRRFYAARMAPAASAQRQRGLVLDLLQRKPRTDVAHPGNARQAAHHEALQPLHVRHDHAQQVIRIAAHQVALHHFRAFGHGILEALELGLHLLFQADLNEHIQAQPQLQRVGQ